MGERSETLISPKLQADQIRSWAAANGHSLEMLPPELDASGGDDTRPILLDAIDRVERGELDGIVVVKFDRLSRSLTGSLRMLERIEAVGGQVRSTSEQLDASSPEGRMTRNILFSVAQMEREHKAAGFESAKADAIRRGVYIGRTPIGYRRKEDRTLEPDPAVAPTISELFVRRAAGENWGELARFMEANLGRAFIQAAVRAIVRNPAYLGLARQGKHRNPDAHEPLTDRATWEAAQASGPKPPRSDAPPALLAGVLRCAGCSRTMSLAITHNGRAYRCRRKHSGGMCPAPAQIAMPLIEGYVADAVLGHLEVSYSATERTNAVGEVERSLAAAETELAAYQEATDVAGLGVDAFAAGMRSRVQKVEEARRDLARARLAAPVLPGPGSLRDLWGDLSVSERGHVLRSSLGVVWVRKGRGLEGRVRMIAAGHEPADLSASGTHAGPIISVGWPDDDLPGEIGAAGA